MRGLRLLPLLLLAAGACTTLASEVPATVHALAYHDVRDEVVRDYDPDPLAVSTANLTAHFRWLRDAGYTAITIDDLLAARAGERPLPAKAVLLTFDDGLRSFYTRVFPLLKIFRYPALLSPVTGWIESGDVPYDHRTFRAGDFVTWAQLREMRASGLVEIASHSHDLHRGIPGNPQGNLQPAAVTRGFAGGHYESESAYAQRITADLAASAAAIERHVGIRPRVVTWPYGLHSAVARAAAARAGMTVSLTLSPETPSPPDETVFGRQLIGANPGPADLAGLLQPPVPPVLRAAQVDLDYVYDPDPAVQEANLGLLLDRVKTLQISHVFLQAFADPDGDGTADALYFPNSVLPVRADLFNRTAWQLKTRSQVHVYAWLPLLAFSGGAIDPGLRVLQAKDGAIAPDPTGEHRLSPWAPEARQVITGLYTDLARYASFQGLHFHDDGRLNEFEDVHPAALAAYRRELGAGFTPDAARADPALGARWADLKARTLVDFSLELAAAVRRERPDIRLSRNLFASAVLDPAGPVYLAQDPGLFLRHYDYVTLMAMPRLENAPDSRRFHRSLAEAIGGLPGGLERTVFQLQTVDWRTGLPVPPAELRATFRDLKARGVRHLAWYPDDFHTNNPPLTVLRPGASLAASPWETPP